MLTDILYVPAMRSGNIIEPISVGASQPVALEVVEACGGIRSLKTLATLLAYFEGKTM